MTGSGGRQPSSRRETCLHRGETTPCAQGERQVNTLAPVHPWLDVELLLGRPNIGSLMALCEENYASLQGLVPDLRTVRGSYRARRSGNLDLYLDVLDQAPYTTSLRLTYYFPASEPTAGRPEPDARLRIYHDARQVEVLALYSNALALLDPKAWTLLDKWRANLFLNKWLGYCLNQGYAFGADAREAVAEPLDRPHLAGARRAPGAALATGTGR